MTAPRPTGCLVCAQELVYLAEGTPVACAFCGAPGVSAVRCPAGHHVCDTCHSASARDVVERACAAATGTDPLELARAVMRHPAVAMHGPEHHFLVPAALLAAWSNARGEPERRAARVAEARRRAEPVLGGFCGLQGACGAAIGAGTFVAIALESSPLKGPERGVANRMTAEALRVIAGTGGARCCKRDSTLALLAAARFARTHLGTALPARGAPCEHADRNRQCTGAECPFYPR